jgi:iron(III) transport system permease protein
MMAWRLAVVLLVGLLLGAPLAFPLTRMVEPTAWQWSAGDLVRTARLAANTALLVGGTCALAVPTGTFLAVLLFRTDLPGRRVLLALLVLILFVPLPVIVSSWQGFLGSGGLLPVVFWASGVDRPWATGWGPSVWVHAVAAVPWVTCIVGLGLRWVEPELEEEARLRLPPWRVIGSVSLPRCRASIGVAALFVALQTAGEIAVTDMMLISTFAEEIYTQFTLGEDPLGRTLLLSSPVLLGVVALLAVAAIRLERVLPPLPFLLRTPHRFQVRPVALWVAVTAAVFAVLILPSAGLAWRLGEAGVPPGWSLTHAWHQLTAEAWLLGRPLMLSVMTAVATGAVVAGLALVCCWLAVGSAPLRAFLLILLSLAWVAPGPVVGISLKGLILSLPEGPWLGPLYFGPSPVPIIWAYLIRTLPPAVLFLWPVVRLIPRGPVEAARLEGAGPLRELLLVVWPTTWRAVGVIAVAVTALALGEIAAAGRAETPGWESFARLLFDRMHYGVDSNVAALSVLLLAALAGCGVLALGGRLLWHTLTGRRR